MAKAKNQHQHQNRYHQESGSGKKAVASKPAAPKTATSAPAVFNIDEINLLLQAVNHSNVNELKLEKGDFKIRIRQGHVSVSAPVAHTVAPAAPSPAPVAAPAPVVPAAPAAPVAAESGSENLIAIKSPMIGTFYRSSGPGKPTFVNVGDDIKVGQVLCIVEAMKLFNEIESEVSGKVVKVLADDATPVEYDHPYFWFNLPDSRLLVPELYCNKN
ncbi:MAG: acetyl-CoA carboxylase biotin carboxyl carrier protein [Bacteroidota bacterium]|nr:MAG: acetyl-CoA carboxylase biotin carboxyl carrier protein [Bacteroidota bacterium]